jgi:hypothetical protein
LFETEPGDVLFGEIHGFLGGMTIICAVWGAIIVIAFGQNEYVVSATERVFEDGDGSEVDIGVMAWRLVGRRSIEVPNAEF